MSQTRREFLKRTGMALVGSAGASLGPWSPGRAWGRTRAVSPNEKVLLGVIGCNGMGFSDIRSLLKIPETECVALCDVDSEVLERRAGQIEERTEVRPQLYGDYRRLLENRDIDAVVIGTPDHWHCLPMIEACEAGKDVYVEKPLANSIAECRLMVEAARRYGRVVQVGQWQRSGPHWHNAVEFVHSGQLGKVLAVKSWAYMDWMRGVPVVADAPPPQGVDYDMWLGPAPKRPFNENRFHFNFRWYWDYAGGLMTDWGVHLIDIVLWGMKSIGPKSVLSSGGKFANPDDAMETPDTQQAIYEFDDFSMIWEHAVGIGLGPFQRSHGVAFIGTNGTLVVDRSQWEIYPEVTRPDFGPKTFKMEPLPMQSARDGEGGLDLHTENFIECIKTRARPRCDPETASLAAVNAHLGNIAFRTGRKLNWNQKKVRFDGDPEANALLEANYRKPWELPKV